MKGVAGHPTSSTPVPLDMRCAKCGSTDVMRDAWANWDAERQRWVLGTVFDAAACEHCGTDATLVESPFTANEPRI